MTPIWLQRASFPLLHPRQALCDAGLWKCSQHPRMLWLASERRWAIRHKLRARRVARWTGWQPGELAALMGPLPSERRETAARRALLARLAGDLAQVAQLRREKALEALLASSEGFAPWQIELLRQMLDGGLTLEVTR
ncbi:hypothetical protein I5G61_gp94 [Mycobacterium phage Quesadilla]|uniref:Uncharacterized protein n=1 Tax=Mycobacterium phage Quesadilla TaxID=2664226 RepID=A0A5Q2WC54_9CAUD|nr:hypothetical protein I5G61_gp94 [Mycobacterium phage Quesadilla]QGH75342.1 hypothetical protein SEA_QUESADILLA_94 [Mycobacterium phage Quesadilla]